MLGSKRFSDSVLSIICEGIMCLAANPSYAIDEDGDGIIEPGEDRGDFLSMKRNRYGTRREVRSR
jgi:hypothetical protein